MTDKELRKLRRGELLELLVEQSNEIDALKLRIQQLEAQLAERKLIMEQAGSIAEASLALTNVFAEAQKAADIYLENVFEEARKAADLYLENMRLAAEGEPPKEKHPEAAATPETDTAEDDTENAQDSPNTEETGEFAGGRISWEDAPTPENE